MVLQRQVAERGSAGTTMRIRTAHFPAVKAIEAFNLDHLPSLRRDVLAHLATGTFVVKAENVILLVTTRWSASAFDGPGPECGRRPERARSRSTRWGGAGPVLWILTVPLRPGTKVRSSGSAIPICTGATWVNRSATPVVLAGGSSEALPTLGRGKRSSSSGETVQIELDSLN